MRTVRLTVEFATSAHNTEEAVAFAAQSVACGMVGLEDAECVVIDAAGMESKVVLPSFADRVIEARGEDAQDW